MELKKALTFAFCILTSSSYSQTDKQLLASISYQVNYVKDGTTVINDICILDVSKKQSYFYSRNVAESKARAAEKFESAKLTNTKPSFNSRDIPPATSYKAYNYKNYEKKQSITIQLVGMQLLGYAKDPIINNNWKIFEETILINGISSRKAQSAKDGVIVTAWFSKDIPIQDGPLAYFGLPGLITKISTTDGWEAELRQIINNKDPKKQIEIVDYTLVNESDVKKAKENAKGSLGDGVLPSGIRIQKQN